MQEGNCILVKGQKNVEIYGIYSSTLQYCPGMTCQDLSRAAHLRIILLYKSCLFPFRHSPDYRRSIRTPVDINSLPDTLWHPPVDAPHTHHPNVYARHIFSYRNSHIALSFSSSLFSFCSWWGIELSTSGFHVHPRATCTNELTTMLKYMAHTLARSSPALEWPVKIFLAPLVCVLFC